MEFIQQYQEICVEALRHAGEVLAWFIPIWIVTSAIIFTALIFISVLAEGIKKIVIWIEERKEKKNGL